MEAHLVAGTRIAASTESVRKSDRLEYWRNVCRSVEIEPIPGEDFRASAKGIMLDRLNVMHMDVSAHSVVRQPEKANDAHADGVLVTFVTSGELLFEQDGRSARISGGDAICGVVGRPFAARYEREGSFTLLRLSGHLWTRPTKLERNFTAKSLANAGQLGQLTSRFIRDLGGMIETLDPFAINRLSQVCVDLLDACIDVMTDEVDPSRSSYKNATLIRVKQFIEANLDDRDLRGQDVASRLKLSTRYLNRLFESEGTSVSRFIWGQRLERAARNLLNPRLRRQSISAIAYEAGFKNLSHFSYAFHERFGMRPSDYRRSSSTSEGGALPALTFGRESSYSVGGMGFRREADEKGTR